jgi:hypothetical protein
MLNELTADEIYALNAQLRQEDREQLRQQRNAARRNAAELTAMLNGQTPMKPQRFDSMAHSLEAVRLGNHPTPRNVSWRLAQSARVGNCHSTNHVPTVTASGLTVSSKYEPPTDGGNNNVCEETKASRG